MKLVNQYQVGKYYAQYERYHINGSFVETHLMLIKYDTIWTTVVRNLAAAPTPSPHMIRITLTFELTDDEIFEHVIFDKFCESC